MWASPVQQRSALLEAFPGVPYLAIEPSSGTHGTTAAPLQAEATRPSLVVSVLVSVATVRRGSCRDLQSLAALVEGPQTVENRHSPTWKAGWVKSPQGFESPILRHADQHKRRFDARRSDAARDHRRLAGGSTRWPSTNKPPIPSEMVGNLRSHQPFRRELEAGACPGNQEDSVTGFRLSCCRGCPVRPTACPAAVIALGASEGSSVRVRRRQYRMAG